jgi:hypothetical protein
MQQVIRLSGRPPDGTPSESRFDSQLDQYYADQLKLASLEASYVEGDTIFLMLSVPAPSLTVKRKAIGIKLVSDSLGDINYYEEMFRTWKMIPDTLQRRSMLLFDRMVQHQSLSPFYTINSKNIEYIEFPDGMNYYDNESRGWKVRGMLP